jgi:hypothetical protein
VVDGFEGITGTLTDQEWKAVPTICRILRESTPGRMVPARALAASVGWKGTHGQARVRRVVHVLRVTGEVRWLVADARGYGRAAGADDVRAYLRSLDQRIASIGAVRKALRSQIDDQIVLDFNVETMTH